MCMMVGPRLPVCNLRTNVTASSLSGQSLISALVPLRDQFLQNEAHLHLRDCPAGLRLLNCDGHHGFSLADTVRVERAIDGEYVAPGSCAGIRRWRRWRRRRASAAAADKRDAADKNENEEESSQQPAIPTPIWSSEQQEADCKRSSRSRKQPLAFRRSPIPPTCGTSTRRGGCGGNRHRCRDRTGSCNV